jgi:hypothetical protein
MARSPATKEFTMLRAVYLVALLLPVLALAQMPHDQRPPQMMEDQHPPGMMHDHMGGMAHAVAGRQATQSGQAAFGAIQEIVEILQADPATDWSKVDIEALRQHLIDMDNVTLHADVEEEPVAGGIRFVVSGSGPVRDSIQRMVSAHARIMNGVDNWNFVAANTETGADLTVTVPAKDAQKLRGLGFIGVLAGGMHHQAHHLMIARGMDPHH